MRVFFFEIGMKGFAKRDKYVRYQMLGLAAKDAPISNYSETINLINLVELPLRMRTRKTPAG
ncbi:MAG: hypothetical protein ACI8ZN_002340 [Bacteroidia bacterium]|jgi:hypothetical protein